MATSILKNLKPLPGIKIVEQNIVEDTTYTASYREVIYEPPEIPGYTPAGVLGWYWSGTNSSQYTLYVNSYYIQNGRVHFHFRSGAATSITITAQILYIKCNQVEIHVSSMVGSQMVDVPLVQNVSYATGAHELTLTAPTVSGYAPVGVLGWYQNSDITNLLVHAMYLTGTTIHFGFRNNSALNGVTITVQVLYLKTS